MRLSAGERRRAAGLLDAVVPGGKVAATEAFLAEFFVVAPAAPGAVMRILLLVLGLVPGPRLHLVCRLANRRVYWVREVVVLLKTLALLARGAP